jgi:hypothetical protein
VDGDGPQEVRRAITCEKWGNFRRSKGEGNPTNRPTPNKRIAASDRFAARDGCPRLLTGRVACGAMNCSSTDAQNSKPTSRRRRRRNKRCQQCRRQQQARAARQAGRRLGKGVGARIRSAERWPPAGRRSVQRRAGVVSRARQARQVVPAQVTRPQPLGRDDAVHF